jgi:predicted ribosomally synthesized peptide with SipW-like signal peptide
MTDEFELSRRRALAALGTIGATGVGAGVGTSAFFADQESFENNALTAGELDLGVGYTVRYSDWSADENEDVSVRMYDGPAGTTGDAADLASGETGLPTKDAWLIAVDDPETFLANTETGSFPTADSAGDDPATVSCADLSQADDASRPVVDLEDVKPGDFGTVTFDFALCDNPGYVRLNGTLRDASETGTTEPEADHPDEVDGAVELLDIVQAAVWVDDGDGDGDGDGYVDGETTTINGSLRAVLDELGTDPGLPLGGDVDRGLGRNCFSHDGDGDGSVDVHHVSLAWWVPVDHSNEIQSDSVTFDLGLYAEQCRHNDGGVDLASVVSTPEVQQLLTDLGHPSPSSTAADGFGAMGPVSLDFDQARTRRLNDADVDPNVYRTVVPSPVGSLRFTSTGSELVTSPAFVFDSDLPETIKARLDVAAGIGWPDGTPAALIGNEGVSAFFRPVSAGERSRAEDALDRPADAGVGFDLAGEGIYVVPPSPDDPAGGTPSLSSDRLVTDGGTADCVALPGVFCDPVATGETAVLDAGFDIVASYSDDELATQLGDERQCLNDYVGCVSGRLEQGAATARYLGETCVRISLAIQSAFLSGLEEVAFELFSRVVPGPQRLLTRFAITFLEICVAVSGVTVLATVGYFVNRCRVSALRCLGSRRSEPSPSPPSPAFETSTTGNADATVVSEDLSGEGELDLRVFRCNTAQAAVVYGDLDTTLTISFDFEIRRTDAFGEDAYFQVYEDGNVVAETGRNLSIIQPTAEITGRVTRTTDVDGDVFLKFGIRSSDFCSNFDHGDTVFEVSNLSVRLE